ncbi:MAG: MFS transporter [Oligoflexia bacterium]|nr:MFS transporter [Oligoflexia bacterium]MBF0365167.1 MFS transporter [Oligoflexia bacterium]
MNYLVLLIVTMASFIAPFMGSSINVALPDIGKEFAMSAHELAWTATSYLLATALFLLPFGRLADLYGRRRFYFYGMIFYPLSSLFCVLSPNTTCFLLSRFLQGVAAAFIFGTGVALLLEFFPQNRRGKVLGINAASVYIGLLLGPYLGGMLTEHFGWRSIFIFIILIMLPIPWLIHRYIPPDILQDIPQDKGPAQRNFKGLIPLHLFKGNSCFQYATLSAFINYAATFGIQFIIGLYLSFIYDLSPKATGEVLMVPALFLVLFSPLAGTLSDRLNAAMMASIGMAITFVGTLLLLLITLQAETMPLYSLLGALAFIGLGPALFTTPNTNAVMSAVDRNFYGVTAGLLAMMRITGQMFSMAIATTVVSVVVGKVAISHHVRRELILSCNYSLAIFMAISFVGIFTSLKRTKFN